MLLPSTFEGLSTTAMSARLSAKSVSYTPLQIVIEQQLIARVNTRLSASKRPGSRAGQFFKHPVLQGISLGQRDGHRDIGPEMCIRDSSFPVISQVDTG